MSIAVIDTWFREQVQNYIEGLDDDAKISLWNAYCEKVNYTDDMIYYMSDIDEFVNPQYCKSVSEFLNQFDLDSFNSNDDYFYFSIYGIRSANYLCDCDSYYEEQLIDHICDEADCLDDSELSDIIDEYNDKIDSEEIE